MRLRPLLLVSLLALCVSPAWASFGGKPQTPPGGSPGSQPSSDDLDNAGSARQQADQWYGDAYDDVTKARQDLTDGNAKDAEKKFKRALDRARHAVEADSTYHQAWNLIGFAARKLGDYPQSLAAYQTCLRIKPDFAPAREYYGEALLETGDVKGAEEQLSWLQRLNAGDLVTQLQAAITAHGGAHADSTAAPAAASSSGGAAH